MDSARQSSDNRSSVSRWHRDRLGGRLGTRAKISRLANIKDGIGLTLAVGDGEAVSGDPSSRDWVSGSTVTGAFKSRHRA